MIKLDSVSTGYYKQKVIENLTLSFERGEFCSILGPNGAGKSTLLKAILGFLPLTVGEIRIKERSIEKWSRKELAKTIAFIPQEIVYQFDYSVSELVLMGRYPYLNYWQSYTEQDREIVEGVLNATGLQPLKEKHYSQLSGGEKQRVNIARALVQDTEAILLDESLVHLDLSHQLEIIELLSEISRTKEILIILVSHNVNLSAEYSDRLIFLKDGRLKFDGPVESVLTSENIKEVFDTSLTVIENPTSKKPNILYPGGRKG
jgi:iron complex transport system ATP-binding protein